MLCSLACRCAKKSQEKSFKYFGLQDYARCFSGQHVASTYNTHGSSNNCYNQHYKKCDDNAWGECVGKNNNVNYVYEIKEGTSAIQYLTARSTAWLTSPFIRISFGLRIPHDIFSLNKSTTDTRAKSMKIFLGNIISEALENSND